MKKILSIFLTVIFIFLTITVCFGKPLDILPRITDDTSYADPLGNPYAYKIIADGENTDKVIDVYDSAGGNWVSLRQLVESMGGSIKWDFDIDKDLCYLGTFNLFGYEYTYFCEHRFDSDLFDNRYNFNLEIFMNQDGKNLHIDVTPWSTALPARYIDDTIYVYIGIVPALFPRNGYLGSFNIKDYTFNVKKYDFEKEKSLMIEKFPEEKLSNNNNYYTWEFEGYAEDDSYIYEAYGDFFGGKKIYNNYFEFEIFDRIYRRTLNYMSFYANYVDPHYENVYFTTENPNEQLYKDLFKACYLDDFEEYDIKVRYDEDLEAYVVYNKEYENADKIDDSYAIAVIRKFDNAVLFVNSWTNRQQEN